MNNFVQRILTGSLFVGLIAASVWWGPLSAQLIFLLCGLLCLNEFQSLIPHRSSGMARFVLFVLALILYLVVAGIPSGYLPGPTINLLWCIPAVLTFSELFQKKAGAFDRLVYSVFSLAYTVLPFALLSSMAFHSYFYDRSLLLGYFILLWSSDSFAYVFGRLLGRNKLFLRHSPGKTWEGSIGGALCTMGIAALLHYFFPHLQLIHWIAIALLIVLTGTMGDLSESMLKRSLGVKDSGKLLPGHGGVLDRFDALLLSVPFVYAWIRLFNL